MIISAAAITSALTFQLTYEIDENVDGLVFWFEGEEKRGSCFKRAEKGGVRCPTHGGAPLAS